MNSHGPHGSPIAFHIRESKFVSIEYLGSLRLLIKTSDFQPPAAIFAFIKNTFNTTVSPGYNPAPHKYRSLMMLPSGKWQYLKDNNTRVYIDLSDAVMPLVPIWKDPAAKVEGFGLWVCGIGMVALLGIALIRTVVKGIMKNRPLIIMYFALPS